jgi:hypothetical protein
VVITVGSWKKLDWLRELQTAEITSLSHDRKYSQDSGGVEDPYLRSKVSAARSRRGQFGGSSGPVRVSPALSNYCNGHVSICLASSCVYVRGKGRC